MRHIEGTISSQYVAMVFAYALALVFFLSVESDAGPCDENKIRQQSIAEMVKGKISEPQADKVKCASTGDLKSGKAYAKSEQVSAIDMKILTKRLKATKAIGLFTKLAIRNDVSDLMDEVRRYRKKSVLATKIKEIRESFEGLLLKIVALLEGDPELSRDLYMGRESIWKSLLEVKA
jgi:hypothetical protein